MDLKKKYVVYFCAALSLFLILTGCASPLLVAYNIPPAKPPVKIRGNPVILVMPFTDARDLSKTPFKEPRTIGKIDVPVFDLRSSRLTLSEDVSAITTNAFIKELTNSGVTVKTGDAVSAGADFILTGEVRDFRLDIVSRDEIALSISAKLTERESGRVVWSDTVTEKESRFAGIMGDTRSSVSNYISETLSKAVRAAIAEMNEGIPAPFTHETSSAPVLSPVAEPQKTQQAPTGRLSITTEPARSKVYIKDVYWGLTPITLDMEPGIYEVAIKKQGYKDSKEKIAVRAGALTELEITLEKE